MANEQLTMIGRLCGLKLVVVVVAVPLTAGCWERLHDIDVTTACADAKSDAVVGEIVISTEEPLALILPTEDSGEFTIPTDEALGDAPLPWEWLMNSSR